MERKQYIEEGEIHEKVNAEKGKKNILLIGDSISCGYRETVKGLLSNIANVNYPEVNCRNTQFVITSLNGWSSMFNTESIDLVYFNCGHWDIAHWNGYELPLTSLDEYTRNIKQIIDQIRMLFMNARVCFATTTSQNENLYCRNKRTNEQIRLYNMAATKVVKEQNASVHDLFAITINWETDKYADYCHFTEEGFKELGSHVAMYVKEMLFL